MVNCLNVEFAVGNEICAVEMNESRFLLADEADYPSSARSG